MYEKPQKTPLSHYLRTGHKIDGFRPDSYADHDLCDMCGGTVYNLDIKGIRSERNSRYQALFQNYEAAKGAGETHKIWQSIGGSTARQSHLIANNQKVKIDEKFRVGGEELFLPNDPIASLSETANCRCSVKYVREDDNIFRYSLGRARSEIKYFAIHPSRAGVIMIQGITFAAIDVIVSGYTYFPTYDLE